ncbi:MAG: quaternary ammonium transporter [Candidatus Eremiobacteraeota bacterium]|nr:quaternary ammonium transporter [Candidatus Eremiobacteraeota bacterium]
MTGLAVSRRAVLAGAASLALAPGGLAGCARRPGGLGVGSKNFTEELVLGELYAQALERAVLAVRRRLDLGTTDIAMAALRRGEIDLYPEYTGTALLTVLHLPPDSDPQRSYETVRRAYAEKYGLAWLRPAPMNDTQALASTPALAHRLALRTLSDLAAHAGTLRLGTVPEFLRRADGLPGLQRRYGGFRFRETRILDNGLKYSALLRGDVDVVVAFSTEGQLKADRLVTFVDDKKLFPVYQVAPVVRRSALDAHPALAKPLDALAPLLTNDAMQAMNLAVEGSAKREPADVAREFLDAHGLR